MLFPSLLFHYFSHVLLGAEAFVYIGQSTSWSVFLSRLFFPFHSSLLSRDAGSRGIWLYMTRHIFPLILYIIFCHFLLTRIAWLGGIWLYRTNHFLIFLIFFSLHALYVLFIHVSYSQHCIREAFGYILLSTSWSAFPLYSLLSCCTYLSGSPPDVIPPHFSSPSPMKRWEGHLAILEWPILELIFFCFSTDTLVVVRGRVVQLALLYIFSSFFYVMFFFILFWC